jgi:hypothetical protein
MHGRAIAECLMSVKTMAQNATYRDPIAMTLALRLR